MGTNHGYYLARYEASKENENKPVSKIGAVWGRISEEEASKVSQNIYSEEDKEAQYIESDLVNSYAWDTAIVYIQAMGNVNYANANNETTGNKALMNTGETNDEKYHIFDMAGNIQEWTTEYSVYSYNPDNTCVVRGWSLQSSVRLRILSKRAQ